MIYSGPEKQGKQGVGILLSKNHINKIIQVSCINERIMSIKLESTPVNTVLVQVYIYIQSFSGEKARGVTK